MSKSLRSGGTSAQATGPISSNSTSESTTSDLPNSLVQTLVQTALSKIGKVGGLLEFAADDVDVGEADTSVEAVIPAPRKQQTAPLPKLRPDHKNTNEYADYEKGTAFLRGEDDDHAVSPNDVAQGSLGDCYLMAAMVAVARAKPEAIEELIADNGDGTFDVNLHVRDNWYGSPKPKTHTLDTRVPEKYEGTPLYAKLGDQSSESQEMWPALLEKALAQEKGGYEDIRGSKIANGGFNYAGALELLTGKGETAHDTKDLDEDEALLHIQKALSEKKPIVAGVHNMKDDPEKADEARKHNVYGNHAYAPESVDLEHRTVSLTNPWGKKHVEAIPIADFMKYYSRIRIGD